MPENGFNGWAIVECMGHRRLAGKVTETTVAGLGMLRVDVPAVAATTYSPAVPEFTQFVAPSSLYALTPCTEEVARATAASSRSSSPASVLQLALPAPAGDRGVDDDDVGAAARDDVPFGDDDEDGDTEAIPMLSIDWRVAIQDILKERQRQVDNGFNAAHDDGHTRCELRRAAECYWAGDAVTWPFEQSAWRPEGKSTDLAKAGALMLAEAERLVRAGKFPNASDAFYDAARICRDLARHLAETDEQPV